MCQHLRLALTGKSVIIPYMVPLRDAKKQRHANNCTIQVDIDHMHIDFMRQFRFIDLQKTHG